MRLLYLFFSLFLFVGCRPPNTETQLQRVIKNAEAATVKLSVPGRECSAFYVGQDIFFTAAHCLDDQELIFLKAQDGQSYLATPIIVDKKLDVATIKSSRPFVGTALELATNLEQLTMGSELVSVGFPGYYTAGFTFEVGYLRDFIVFSNARMLLSSNIGYPGESGGPVILVKTGQVVGLNDMMQEIIREFDEKSKSGLFLHQHNTLSLSVGFPELQEVLVLTRAQIAKSGGT